MANTYKNIVITPNIGSSTDDPKIQFSGANTTVNTDITLRVYPTSNGTLSFEGSAGQLFSITNDLTGVLFSVNDVSGIPSIEVNADGTISLAPLGGNVVIGNTSEFVLGSGAGLYANGSLGTDGQVLTSNGTTVYWANAGGSGGGYYKGGSTTIGTLGSQGQNLFRVNANTLNNNTTISTGENAQATGPISVASGITLTVESGARVAIV